MEMRKHSTHRFCWILLFVLMSSFGFMGCGQETTDDDTTELIQETTEDTTDPPINWTDESHSDSAEPSYETVFNSSTVKRIDLVVEPNDWQAMIDDMTDLCGPFGGGGGIPQEIFDACEGLEPLDTCEFTIDDREIEGACMDIPIMGGLACLPSSFFETGDQGPGGPGQSAMSMLERDPVYQTCTVNFDGKTWQHVGIRFKGNSSLVSTWSRGSYKLPFRLDFDRYEDDYPDIKNQRFYGFEKLTFSSGFSDNALIREKVVADIFRDAGIPSPRTAFYRVYIDHGEGPIYFGLYTMVEDPDGPMLDTQFNNSGGNLYKPIGTTFADFEQDAFVKKTNEDEADWSDVEAMYEALQADRTDAAAWRSGLESVFDVDGFLQYLAINTVVTNWDTYGNMPHNYYLYFDSDKDVLRWIPWDNNMSMMTMPSMMGRSGLSLELSEIDDSWPLIRYLMDDPVYHKRYLFFVNETVTGVFDVERITPRFTSAYNLIAPYVIGPDGEKEEYTLLPSPADFEQSLQQLLNFVERRQTASMQFLSDEGYSPAAVVINEIHYNPISEPGDDYEFIELTNMGNETVDLSGYTFSGIDFTFAADTAIEPGEYVLVCKNTETYADKTTQVFQWDGGNLSNKGESLVLKDTDDSIIDYIRYADRGNWPKDADGEGFSLELLRTDLVNSMGENWKAVTIGGTPGQANDTLATGDDR